MASDGSKGPKPYVQRKASTVFLRVPAEDWAAVRSGHKTEFRGQPGRGSLKFVDPPTPVVAWSYSRTRGHNARLMILEDRYEEELMAVSPEALEREGHPDIAHYRRYMIRREGKRFRPLLTVVAFVLRPWEPEDHRVHADLLLERLYGKFLPDRG